MKGSWSSVSDPVNPDRVMHLTHANGMVGVRDTVTTLLEHGFELELVMSTVNHDKLWTKKGFADPSQVVTASAQLTDST